MRSFTAPEGRHIEVTLCRPSGLSPQPLQRPTAHAVGYVLSFLTGLAKS